MKVKIIKAEWSLYWYTDKIGEIFEVEINVSSPDRYDVINTNQEKMSYSILKRDCRILIFPFLHKQTYIFPNNSVLLVSSIKLAQARVDYELRRSNKSDKL